MRGRRQRPVRKTVEDEPMPNIDGAPLYTRLMLYVPGMGWRLGYVASYIEGRRAVIERVPGKWGAKAWRAA